MLSFDELKSLLVSFMVQFYRELCSMLRYSRAAFMSCLGFDHTAPSPPVPSTFPAIPPAECCPPDVVVKLVSNWHAFRRVLRAFDVDGVGTVRHVSVSWC
jgi:hypothetical protein